MVSDCRFGVSPVNYPYPDPEWYNARLVIERFLVRFRVDAILLCVYFSVPFIFLFFFFSYFDKKTESKGIQMLLDNMSSLKMRGL